MSRTLLAATTALVGLATASAGRAATVPFAAGAEVSMPRQRAVTAWNGEEQVLVLCSDLVADRATRVLCVVPFPSEPEVRKADASLFRKGTDQINEKLFPRAPPRRAEPGRDDAGTPDRRPAGEVEFAEIAEVEDLKAVQFRDRAALERWALDHLRQAGVEQPELPAALRPAAEEYFASGVRWFAVHVVQIGTEVRTTEAVQYRFDSPAMYYPLRIYRTEAGAGTFQLVLVTPRLLCMPRLDGGRVRLMHVPVGLTEDELGYLDKTLDSLLDHRRGMMLRLWEIQGRLSGFGSDVWTTWY